jgi:Asp/Glu/hydantoin racemase
LISQNGGFKMVRIALIHATELSIPPSKKAFASLWPQAEPVHLMDDSLSRDRLRGKETSSRISALAYYAVSVDVQAILYTCSAFGKAISDVQRELQLPVFKPNEAMFELAFKAGKKIAMLATFKPSIQSMEKEYYEAAAKGATLTTYLVEGAREASDSGNLVLHNHLIAEAIKRFNDFDAVMLAHFSMSPALELCQSVTQIPVLTAPETAVKKIRECRF